MRYPCSTQSCLQQSQLFYCNAGVSKVASCAILSLTHNVDTPPQKHIEALSWRFFEYLPALLDESLQFRKELFNRVEARRVRRQIEQRHTSFLAHLPQLIRLVERCIVQHKHRVSVRPRAAMLQKLCYEVFEQRAVRSSLVHAREQDAILSICCQDLMSPVAVESSNLDRSCADRRSAGPCHGLESLLPHVQWHLTSAETMLPFLH
jgi:hypothetical protein